jgi:hypothetical protein
MFVRAVAEPSGAAGSIVKTSCLAPLFSSSLQGPHAQPEDFARHRREKQREITRSGF